MVGQRRLSRWILNEKRDLSVIDTSGNVFCQMSQQMRVFCFLLTMLLLASLIIAIANSMKNSSIHSASYCIPSDKQDTVAFNKDYLCPEENLLYYYICCKNVNGKNYCCYQTKHLLLISFACLFSSFLLVLLYGIWSLQKRCKPF